MGGKEIRLYLNYLANNQRVAAYTPDCAVPVRVIDKCGIRIGRTKIKCNCRHINAF